MRLTKFIALFLLVVISAFAFAGCGPSGPPTVGDVVSAKSLDGDYKPVDPTTTYKPADKFQLSVEVKNVVEGTAVNVKYSVDGEPYEESTITAKKAGSGYYGFSLTPNENGHQPGNYKADVYLDGALAKTVEFTVEQDGEPTITKVVFAKSIDANNKPADLTDSYAPTEKIYVSALAENMVKGAKIDIKVLYEGQEIADSFDVKHPGTQYFTMSVSPADNGNPVGDYKVEVYLDGKLAQSGSFSVK